MACIYYQNMAGSLLLYHTTRYFSPCLRQRWCAPDGERPLVGTPGSVLPCDICGMLHQLFDLRDEHMAGGAMSTPCLKMNGPKMAFQREMGHITIDRKYIYIGCSVDGPLWTYMGRLWQTMGICFGFRMSESFSTRVYGGYKQPTYGISWG